ncbi:MAG: carbohydrate ABC transporter permease [Alphaproteobacteria bacterium]|nr:carbohydrate ABC transporter permease [Alphaproteobacteria bacterium]MBN9498094.1 carbohydrate ABC transporter permease [Alphaproteobacteria bacterium]
MRRPLYIKALRGLALLAIAFWSAFPIALVVLSSFKPARDIFVFPPTWAFTPTFANYAGLWLRWPDFFRTLGNSLIVTLGATALAVIVSAMAGYVYSRKRNPYLAGSAFFMIFVRLFPPIVVTLPLFPLVNALRLNDTHLILVILYATFFVSMGTMILKAFVDQIPRELDEAAMVDGAGVWSVFWRVILPLSAQGMIAVGVFVFVYAWNEFLFAFIFTTSAAKTAPLVLSEMTGAVDGVEWGVLFAATTVQLVPVLIFVLLAQKYLIAGLTAGATKG